MAMFESLSKRLEGVFTNLSGKGKLTEADVDEAMREVRLALLEADVSLKLVRQFVEHVKAKAVGADVLGSFSPAQQVLQIVNDELIEMLGGSDGNNKLDLGGAPPHVIMLVGLQGSGKTTTAAKLALRIRKEGRRPFLIAADLSSTEFKLMARMATSSPGGSLPNSSTISARTSSRLRNLPAPSSRRSRIRTNASGLRAWPSRLK